VPAVTASYSGFVNGDSSWSLTPAPTCSSSVASSSPVGRYPTSCQGAADLNYSISYVGGSVAVTPVPLSVTASSATVTYGATPPPITPSYSGLVNGDSASSLATRPTCSTTATSSSPLGTYVTKCAGAVDPNYSIGYLNGTLTVGPSAMLVLGSGAGAITINGQSALTVQGGLAVNSSSTGGVNLSGQSALNVTGALISPAAHPVASSGQSTTSLTAQETLAPEADPYAGLTAPSSSGMTVYGSTTIQGPGVYTKAVTIGAQAHVQLASGTYVFDNGLTISGQATVTSAPGGVLVYLAGGALNINGQAGATLSPLASGTFQGITLFEARSDTQAIVLSGQGQASSVVGLVYAPSAAVDVSGQSRLALGGLIVGSADLTGQSGATVG
jgi:hypothetical protein